MRNASCRLQIACIWPTHAWSAVQFAICNLQFAICNPVLLDGFVIDPLGHCARVYGRHEALALLEQAQHLAVGDAFGRALRKVREVFA